MEHVCLLKRGKLLILRTSSWIKIQKSYKFITQHHKTGVVCWLPKVPLKNAHRLRTKTQSWWCGTNREGLPQGMEGMRRNKNFLMMVCCLLLMINWRCWLDATFVWISCSTGGHNRKFSSFVSFMGQPSAGPSTLECYHSAPPFFGRCTSCIHCVFN